MEMISSRLCEGVWGKGADPRRRAPAAERESEARVNFWAIVLSLPERDGDGEQEEGGATAGVEDDGVATLQ